MPTGRNELKIALILAIFFLLGISLILLINPSSPPPPVRNNQKTICASFGIQLPNYAGKYPVNASDAADWMFVEYDGSSLECDSSKSILQNFTAQCKIGDPEGGLIALQVNGTHCRFIEKKS